MSLNKWIVSLTLCLFLLEIAFAGADSYRGNKNQQLISDSESAQYYCDRAAQTQPPEREANLLLCANAFLKSGKNDEAKRLLNQLKQVRFEGNMAPFKLMVDGRYALNLGNPSKAISLLKNVSVAQLSLPLLIEYRDLLARAYEKEGNYLQSVVERVELDSQLSDRDLANINNSLIWETLQQINLRTLQGASKSTTNPVLKGWLELAAIARQLDSTDLNYQNAIARWQSDFRGHPGEALLPSNPSSAATDELQPKHIALLLPLSGKLSSSAEAIRDGFLAASHLHQRHSISAPIVSVIDTRNDQQVASAYETALNQGADIIVGPLTKKGVEEIIQVSRGATPILALNYVDGHTPENVFLFGLSPEDEAKEVAMRAYQDGRRRALIVAQSGDWGDRVTQAFADRWEQLGGQTVSVTTYSPGETLSNVVKSALRVDTSETRAKQLREDIHQSFEFDGRRRQDIDMIFMIAQPREARQLPSLFAFYFAHDLPVYTVSGAYSGQPNPIADKDLNGVILCDIPWAVDARPETSDSSEATLALWPHPSQPNLRLYALGVDAYEVLPLLPRLETFPHFAYHGATGQISLTANRHLTRALRCSEFVSGELKKLGSNG